MKLAGGSIEKVKENLAKFFVKHDQDITQEQANYLANFTINLLTDVGGRMVFHQVAAKGFKKVSRGVKGGVKDATKATKIVEQNKAHIGTKLEYLFGKATGPVHNIERSRAMLKQLQSVGIYDNTVRRSLLQNHLKSVYRDTQGILQSNGRYARESMLMGPNGALKMESIWEGNKLITVKLFGGR